MTEILAAEPGAAPSTDLWSGVAAAWDTHVDVVDDQSRDETAALLERLAVHAGDAVLELAAGPGSLAATWSRLTGPTGRVVVSDLSPTMVEVAQRRAAGLGNVETVVLDASAIDGPDGSFDVVASRMGLMFAPDPAVALAESHRVLRAGGRFGALTWGALGDNPWLTCLGIAAMMHGVATGGPPIGPGEIFSLGDPVRLEALASAAGLDDVRVESYAVTFRATSIDEHLDRVTSLAGPLASRLRAAAPDVLAAVRQTAAGLAAPHVDDDGHVTLPGRALLVSGQRRA